MDARQHTVTAATSVRRYCYGFIDVLRLPRRIVWNKSRLSKVPDGLRVYAIGDVHGRLDLLDNVLDQISADCERRGATDVRLIFLGDLIDRGPNSAEVVERVRQLMRDDTRVNCLMGNHEEMLLQALSGDQKALRLFNKFGGRETVLSYGLSAAEFPSLSFDALLEEMRARIPETHILFMQSLADYIEIGDYAFVHAGIRPGSKLAVQKGSDLRWIREPFLSHSADHDKLIVHGHTVTPDADIRRNRIGIDTGAGTNGKLTALGLEKGQRWLISST